MHFWPRPLIKRSNITSKAKRRNAFANYAYEYDASSPKQDLSYKHPSYVSSTEFDWEVLDDYETTAKLYYGPLADTLRSKDAVDSTVLALISHEFSSGSILHEAIKLGAPDDVLMLLVERFPKLLTQVDDGDRYPIHTACAFGASSAFVSRCINMYPSSTRAMDVEGKSPFHLLCQGTWQGAWDIASNPAAAKNMKEILWMLYREAPSTIVSEDIDGVEPLEHAIDFNIGIGLIHLLQEMIGHFHEHEVRKMAHCKR